MRSGLSGLLVMVVLLPLAGCASDPAGQDATAQVSFDYTRADRQNREWRGLLTAMDRCHQQGYRDAWPKGTPVSTCRQVEGDACTLYHERAAYDCVGMGYQPF